MIERLTTFFKPKEALPRPDRKQVKDFIEERYRAICERNYQLSKTGALTQSDILELDSAYTDYMKENARTIDLKRFNFLTQVDNSHRFSDGVTEFV